MLIRLTPLRMHRCAIVYRYRRCRHDLLILLIGAARYPQRIQYRMPKAPDNAQHLQWRLPDIGRIVIGVRKQSTKTCYVAQVCRVL